MDFKYLNTLKTIVEEGSFHKAAERLNYTQSTITFQIGQLEQELSTKLFEKVGRRMLLSKAGTQLVPYVENVLASVEQMHFFKNELAAFHGALHIGVGETLLCYQMPTILKAFHQQAPNAQLFLRSMNCYDIRDSLLNGTLDIGVFYENVGGFGTKLTTYAFGSTPEKDSVKYPLCLVASSENKSRYPDFRTADQTIPIPFIINEPTCIFRQIFENYLREKSIRLAHTIELWSIPTIKKLVKSDVGISFLPRFTVQSEIDSGELMEIEIDMPNPYITAVCAHHNNKWISPLMQLFIHLITKKRQDEL